MRLLEPPIRFALRRGRVVLGATLVLGALFALAARRVQLEPDVLALLPAGGPAVGAFQTYVRRFGTLDHVYVAFEAPSGHTIDEYQDLVAAYVEGLRGAPEIAEVDAAALAPGKDWTYVFDRELYLLGVEGAKEALARLTPDGAEEALARARDRLAAASPGMTAWVREDPLALLPLLRGRLAGGAGGGLALAALEPGYVTPDGTTRLVAVKPTRPPFDARFCVELQARLQEVERNARARMSAAFAADPGGEAEPPAATIEAVGAYQSSLEAEALIHREMRNNALGSLIPVLLLALLAYRSPLVLVCAAWTMGLAALGALAFAGLREERLLAAAAGGSAMLFGLGMDGIFVLYNRLFEESASGRDADRQVAAAAATSGSMFVANLTTVATFAGLLVVDNPSLQELGRLVGISILLCGGLTLVVVPAFFGLGGGRAGRASRPQPLRAVWLGRFVDARHRAILVGAGALTLVLGAAAPRLRVDTSLDRLQPATRAAEAERRIASRFGLPTRVLLVLAEGPALEPLLEQHARLAEALAPLGDRVGVSAPSSLVPPAREQDAVADLLRDPDLEPARVERELREAARRVGFRPGALDPFFRRLPALLDPARRVTHDGYEAHGLGSLAGRYVARGKSGFTTVTYLYPKPGMDLDRVIEAVRGAGPGLALTGAPMVDRELGRQFLPQLGLGLLVGTVAVVLLIYASFRRAGLTLLALVPTALALVWSAGVLALLDVELDLFSAFGVVMVVGIGVDYGIHVLHRRFVEGTPRLLDVLARTAPPILLAAATTLLGFGTLVSSSYAPLRAMGTFCTVTLVASVLTSLVVMPAFLRARGVE